MKHLKKTHFSVGVLSFLAFLISGLYMNINVAHIADSDIATRMMFRANHIYILLAALINLFLSFTFRDGQLSSKIFYFSSALVTLATLTLNLSFYVDPITKSIEHRELSAYSIEVLFAGCAIHLWTLWLHEKKN